MAKKPKTTEKDQPADEPQVTNYDLEAEEAARKEEPSPEAPAEKPASEPAPTVPTHAVIHEHFQQFREWLFQIVVPSSELDLIKRRLWEAEHLALDHMKKSGKHSHV